MSKVTIGLDLGDRYSHLVVLDSEGEVTEETRIPTTESAMRRWFARIERARPRKIPPGLHPFGPAAGVAPNRTLSGPTASLGPGGVSASAPVLPG